MKYFYNILFVVILSKSLLASDYNYNMEGIGTSTSKTMTLNNGIKFLLYENNIGWTDNLGNYGLSKCMGTVTTMSNNDITLNIMCENTDKNGYKTWSVAKRSGSSMSGGIGYLEIVDSTVPYKDLLIGTKCKYAINYLKNVSFTMTKCPVSNDLYTKILDLVESVIVCQLLI